MASLRRRLPCCQWTWGGVTLAHASAAWRTCPSEATWDETLAVVVALVDATLHWTGNQPQPGVHSAAHGLHLANPRPLLPLPCSQGSAAQLLLLLDDRRLLPLLLQLFCTSVTDPETLVLLLDCFW